MQMKLSTIPVLTHDNSTHFEIMSAIVGVLPDYSQSAMRNLPSVLTSTKPLGGMFLDALHWQ
jgi:hypothetical protein